jgi:hypothetical protein
VSEPLFVPPIRFSLIKAVGAGQLQALDVIIYQYLLAHTDDWVIRRADVCEQLGLAERTYARAMSRLKAAGLIADGGFNKATKRRQPPKLIRLGQYEKPGPEARVTSGPITRQVTDQEPRVTSGPGCGPDPQPLPRAITASTPSAAPGSSSKAALRIKATSSACPLGCGISVPSTAGVEWANAHARDYHRDRYDACRVRQA